jgi:hypothetical protein
MTAVPGKGLPRGTKIGEGLNTDRWMVQKKLGEGGFAEVYEVSDTLNRNEKVNSSIKPHGCSRRAPPVTTSFPHEILVACSLFILLSE